MHSRLSVVGSIVISRKFGCSATCLSPTGPAHAKSAKSLPSLLHIVCLDNLILAGRDHPEVIRNSISELWPLVRQGFSKEPENRGREGVVGGVMSILVNPLVHDSPKALNGCSIDLFVFDEGELEGFEINRALNVEPLAVRFGSDRRLLTFREPAMSGTALILGMHGVRNGASTLRRRQLASSAACSSSVIELIATFDMG